jgi:hypothetical protein
MIREIVILHMVLLEKMIINKVGFQFLPWMRKESTEKTTWTWNL